MAKGEMAVIRGIVERIRQHHNKMFDLPDGDGSIKEWFEQDDALYEELLEAVPDQEGLVPGKIVDWPAADGCAIYVVAEVGPQVCKMLHVPYGDAWTATCVDQNGYCLTSIVAEAVRQADLPPLFDRE